MSTTFLQAVNDVLTESNEIQLTSSTFASAVGVQAYAKNIINRAYLELCSSNKEWPFLAAGSGNSNDPFAGNVYVEISEGVRWGLLKAGSTSTTTDFGKVDWDTFFITTEGVAGATTPYEYKNLPFISFDEWTKSFRETESKDAGDPQTYGIPERVIVSQDGRFFGLSPIPNKDYRVYFSAWVRPSRLTAFNDVLLIPDEYTPVLYDKARYFMHMFKENEIQANFAKADFNKGQKQMSHDLVGTNITTMSDDRVRV